MTYEHYGCYGCKYMSTEAVDFPCRECKNTQEPGSAKYKSMPDMYEPAMTLQEKSDAIEAYCDTRDGCTRPDMCPAWRGDGKSACYDSEAERLPESKQKEIAEAYEILKEKFGGDGRMTRLQILKAAAKCVCGDREQDYGSPENNFGIIAEMWNAYLHGRIIYAKDVAAMLALLKIARISSGNAKDDNWIDLAGYAACGGEIESNEVRDGRDYNQRI